MSKNEKSIKIIALIFTKSSAHHERPMSSIYFLKIVYEYGMYSWLAETPECWSRDATFAGNVGHICRQIMYCRRFYLAGILSSSIPWFLYMPYLQCTPYFAFCTTMDLLLSRSYSNWSTRALPRNLSPDPGFLALIARFVPCLSVQIYEFNKK